MLWFSSMEKFRVSNFGIYRPAAVLIFFITLSIALCGWQAASAQKRSALIIGNEKYLNALGVPKAEADAKLMAGQFNSMDFNVSFHLNLDKVGMSTAVKNFLGATEEDSFVIFYFIGSGVGFGSKNVLLATDIFPARLGDEERIVADGFVLNDLLANLRAKNNKVLSIIDAAHDNPFDRPGVRSPQITTGIQLFGSMPSMSYILAAAGPNEESRVRLNAKDLHPNSVFGRTLLSQFKDADISISELATSVRGKVIDLAKANNFTQTPMLSDGGIGNLSLTGRPSQMLARTFAIRVKADGNKRYRLSEVSEFEDALPSREQCEILGLRFGDQLRREGGESVRFWVRIRRGDIGYCQRVQNQWYVEYYDRNIQDGLLVDLKK